MEVNERVTNNGTEELTCHNKRLSQAAQIKLLSPADIRKHQLVIKLLKHAFSYQDTTYLIASSIKADTELLLRAGVSLLPALAAPQHRRQLTEHRRALSFSLTGQFEGIEEFKNECASTITGTTAETIQL